MKVITLIALFLLQGFAVLGYLGETYAPFTISLRSNVPTTNNQLVLKPGSTIEITWYVTLVECCLFCIYFKGLNIIYRDITPGVRFPIYGYASSRTSKTDSMAIYMTT